MHTIKHHLRGIKMVLAMLPRLGIKVPKELKEDSISQMNTNSPSFNLHRELNFFEKLIELMNDPLIGLKLSRAYPPAAYGFYGLTMLVAPNLRTMLNFISEYGRLSYSLMNFSFDTNKETAFFRLHPSKLKLSPQLHTFFANRGVGASIFAFETVMHKPIEYTEIGLIHDGQGRQQEYKDWFGCDVKFNQNENYCAMPLSLIDDPLPLGQQDTFEQCKSQCAEQLLQLAGDNDLLNLIRQEFYSKPGYLHDLPSIAAQFNMSERTLRRRLAEVGTSFNNIQQEIRYQKAREYLINSNLHLKEIAELLGYSEAASFCNAFKRWSGGIPPKQFKLNH